MQIDLNQQEAQFIVDAIDAYVKQHGLQAAGLWLTITTRLHVAFDQKQPQGDSDDDPGEN